MPRPFQNAVLTDQGASLLTRSLAGELHVEFTKMVVGSGEYSEQEKTVLELQKRTELKTPQNRYVFSDISIHNEHSVKLTALITNHDPVTKKVLVEEGYYINEIGIYAKEKDNADASEVLYSISITSGEKGDYMPAYNGNSPAQITQDFFAVVGNSGDVVIHSVGAALLKDGEASDTTVIFSEAENRENISSREKLSTLFGKISKFFSDLKTVAFSGSYNDLTDKPAASSTIPKANGTAAAGSETNKFARGDHVHPLQTSVSGSSGSCTGNAASATKATQDGNGNNIANTYLPKSGGTMTGTLTIGGYSILFRENRVIRSNNANGIEFYRTDASGTGYAMWINNGGNDEFTPRKDGGSVLGRSNARWGQIYSTNSAVSTSDRRMKHDISYIGKDSNYDTAMTDEQLEAFMMGLMACIYRLNDGTSGRPHHGFVAQDIEKLLREIGLVDHAAFIKSPKTKDVEVEKEIEEEIEDPDTGEVKIVKKTVKELQHQEIPGEYIYSLRYEEFIADIIRFVQIQKNRADDLEERLAITEQKNLELEKRLKAVEQLIK